MSIGPGTTKLFYQRSHQTEIEVAEMADASIGRSSMRAQATKLLDQYGDAITEVLIVAEMADTK
jgi:hypothetical protein